MSSVLIADNNVDAADSLALLLRLHGYEVATARTGPETLAVARTFAPDAILMDVALPKIDGYEIARRLRAATERPLLLVAVTGYGREEDRRRAQEAGFDYHLIKPADPVSILNLLSVRA